MIVLGSLWGLTFEFFRRCPSTRPAKGRPRVRIALCARIEVRPLRARLENQPKITPRGLPERAVRRIVDLFAPGGDSASISVVSPGYPFRLPGAALESLRALPDRLWAPPGRAGDAPRRSWVPRPTKVDRRSPEEASERRFGTIFERIGIDLGGDFEVVRRCASTRCAKGRP